MNDFPDAIHNTVIYADDTTLYSECDKTSTLWQLLELAFELLSDLRITLDWGKKWLADFSAGKTTLLWFFDYDWSNNSGAIDVKLGVSVLKEKIF